MSKDAVAEEYAWGIQSRKCGNTEHRTVYTRRRAKGKIGRRRECRLCGYVFSSRRTRCCRGR